MNGLAAVCLVLIDVPDLGLDDSQSTSGTKDAPFDNEQQRDHRQHNQAHRWSVRDERVNGRGKI